MPPTNNNLTIAEFRISRGIKWFITKLASANGNKKAGNGNTKRKMYIDSQLKWDGEVSALRTRRIPFLIVIYESANMLGLKIDSQANNHSDHGTWVNAFFTSEIS